MYKHLGGQVCSNSDMREEIAFRAGSSHSVERSLRNNLFANPRLPFENAFYVSQFFVVLEAVLQLWYVDLALGPCDV